MHPLQGICVKTKLIQSIGSVHHFPEQIIVREGDGCTISVCLLINNVQLCNECIVKTSNALQTPEVVNVLNSSPCAKYFHFQY